MFPDPFHCADCLAILANNLVSLLMFLLTTSMAADKGKQCYIFGYPKYFNTIFYMQRSNDVFRHTALRGEY